MMYISALIVVITYCLVACSPIHAVTHFIFAHGLGGDDEQVQLYKSGKRTQLSLVPDNCVTFNFPDAEFKGVGKKRIKLPLDNNKVTLAQEGDIQALNAIYKQVRQETPDSPIVLVGMSRGAATIVTFAATEQPQSIKALILEAPFDSLEQIIAQLKKKYAHASQATKDAVARAWHFPNYKKNGIKPITVIDKIDKNIPVLLIHSQQDTLIPVSSSRILYNRLKATGHTHVYLLELPYGEHAQYQLGKSAASYTQVVHAFYKKYGIPYDPELARKGQKLFNSIAMHKSINCAAQQDNT
jgi:pimeloyl-ACP methyl ester carboxylesterase